LSGLIRYIAVDSRAYKGPASAIEEGPNGQKFVTAPDGYKYLLVDTGKSDTLTEPFLFVSINVADLGKSKKVGNLEECFVLLAAHYREINIDTIYVWWWPVLLGVWRVVTVLY